MKTTWYAWIANQEKMVREPIALHVQTDTLLKMVSASLVPKIDVKNVIQTLISVTSASTAKHMTQRRESV
jgi:hypothetical protein